MCDEDYEIRRQDCRIDDCKGKRVSFCIERPSRRQYVDTFLPLAVSPATDEFWVIPKARKGIGADLLEFVPAYRQVVRQTWSDCFDSLSGV